MTTSTTPCPITPAPHPAGAPWSFDDAATYLGVSARHLRRLTDAGRLGQVRIGRRTLLPDAEVQRLAREGC